MKRKHFIIVLLCFFTSMACLAQQETKVNYGNNPQAGNYFNNNGAKVYYEVYGEGKPLVLLHGNGGSIRSRAAFIEEFSKKYKVIAFDSRCHGRSDCPVGYLTYEQMADDVDKVLQDLGIDSAYVWGHSDGGIVGLLLAIHFPVRVKKLLATGANLRPDSTAVEPGLFPLLHVMEKQAKADSIHYKQFLLLVQQPHIPVSDLQKIKSDVLIMAGDRDAIRVEHTMEIFKNIPGALLCILPGTTHFVYADRPQWFKEILYDFFDNPPRRTTTVELMSEAIKK
ncbi:MAG TPA: alpha/beta hydrolase [Chitinophagaceae bacterium]|nr:alpha/beta hydrolase [Chitinophagaceae bacterium]